VCSLKKCAEREEREKCEYNLNLLLELYELIIY
jgi:hypothetical protein